MDTIEAKKNLEIYKKNVSLLQNYNHLFSSHTFKTECERQIKSLKDRMKVLEDAFAKEAQRNKKASLY
ncbi:hypothetical protein [Acinetobacter haemolyticus]|uniref:hypothetical protein n=1 Tax=Acinetobacter haemolyticus TaxID=29430 RepID=UPI001331C512|nr:hypothetical protein [Acinetobacter haemolyticus]NAR86429.1 hypothetical protein [Acinetobacter haemolyticus]QHI16227.1 hypothetical protein AhaeAN4_06295 [Acinetobacter haemolyticus]QHI17088.1 hypothetical protein AhaeAN4_11070 [Acinetobacter haemolyticus]